MGLSGTVDEVTSEFGEAEKLIDELFTSPPEDPYPLFHRMREIAPVHRRPTGVWTLARYDDIARVLRDPRFIRDWKDMTRRQLGDDVDLSRPMLESRRWQFQHSNPPEYMQKRSVFAKFLTPGAVDELRGEVERYADALLDAAEERGGIEVVSELSYGMTLTLICKILGFPPPEGGAAQWLDWFRAFGDTFQPVVTEKILDDADDAMLMLNEMMGAQLQEMRRNPGDNLITKLMQAEYDGSPLSDEEIISNAILMFSASVGTSADLVSNMIVCLMQNRDQWDLVVQDPDKYVKGAVEETLRYDTSVTVNVPSRVAAEDVEIGGMTIPAGDVVVPLFAAGNRDPERYENPDSFDITRQDVRPLSFGGGPHICPGAHLARAEAEIVLRALATRFPNMTLVNDEAPRRTTSQQRGAERLNVRFS